MSELTGKPRLDGDFPGCRHARLAHFAIYIWRNETDQLVWVEIEQDVRC